MDSKIYQSILKTVCYADIFEYSLKEAEVNHWVTTIEQLNNTTIQKANGVISHKKGFIFLRGRDWLIRLRKEREKISQRKLSIAKRAASILRYVPTIKLIGVSGSVAMANAKEGDDIDFFIVAQAGTLWLTRLCATIVVEVFANRRRPNDTDVADKICLNMFVNEEHLEVAKEKQNLYTAHEVCQLKVLYDRDNTYQRFLRVNTWVRKYLPNGLVRMKDEGLRIKKENSIISFIIESIAKYLQLWYMRRHRTSELITDHSLAFHPKDYTNDILTALEKRMLLYGSKV